jgi:two-component system phosphate regulon response regulator OmpR
MNGKCHVLVVDDEVEIRETIEEYLELHGFEVSTADGGAAMRAIVEAADPPVEIVLLDINMPGEDGLSLARHLQGQPGIGVIMVTAAGEVVDRVVGLEMGADDYVAKPFDLRELLARVRSLQRRMTQSGAAHPAAAGAARTSSIGPLTLDLDARKLLDAEAREIELTSMEFDLLCAFVENPNKVLSRNQLLELAHHRHWEPFDRSIDVRVTRLRRKVETDPTKPQMIKTIRGAGYMYVPEGDG